MLLRHYDVSFGVKRWNAQALLTSASGRGIEVHYVFRPCKGSSGGCYEDEDAHNWVSLPSNLTPEQREDLANHLAEKSLDFSLPRVFSF